LVRNYDDLTGEAEARYGLGTKVEGNDNWNDYAFSHGRWHIAGCTMKFPMFGHGSTAGAAAVHKAS
jgi:hypothetical protein